MDRFSKIYLQKIEVVPDNQRLRSRIAALLLEILIRNSVQTDVTIAIRNAFNRELGAEIVSTYASGLRDYLRKCEVADFLDSVTLAFNELHSRNSRIGEEWRQFISRVFAEENAAYQIDVKCIVHYRVDQEFERNAQSAIAGLARPEFENVRTAVDRAFEDIRQAEPDKLSAIRNMFEANESLFKLVTMSQKSLDETNAKTLLAPVLQAAYSGIDKVAISSALRICESYSKWVSAAHPYRHGHGVKEKVEPPTDLAIELVSQGASFIRWLTFLKK